MPEGQAAETQPSEAAGAIFSHPSHTHLESHRPVLSLVDESFTMGPSSIKTATDTQWSQSHNQHTVHASSFSATLLTSESISFQLRMRTKSRKESFEVRVNFSLGQGEQMKPKLTAMGERSQGSGDRIQVMKANATGHALEIHSTPFLK